MVEGLFVTCRYCGRKFHEKQGCPRHEEGCAKTIKQVLGQKVEREEQKPQEKQASA